VLGAVGAGVAAAACIAAATSPLDPSTIVFAGRRCMAAAATLAGVLDVAGAAGAGAAAAGGGFDGGFAGVTGASSGARWIVYRVRAAPFVARPPSDRTSMLKLESGAASALAVRAWASADCHEAASTTVRASAVPPIGATSTNQRIPAPVPLHLRDVCTEAGAGGRRPSRRR
jgi:hypothetical protein